MVYHGLSNSKLYLHCCPMWYCIYRPMHHGCNFNIIYIRQLFEAIRATVVLLNPRVKIHHGQTASNVWHLVTTNACHMTGLTIIVDRNLDVLRVRVWCHDLSIWSDSKFGNSICGLFWFEFNWECSSLIMRLKLLTFQLCCEYIVT